MGHVFLSYARQDRTSAQRIARSLESAGHEVWWDKHLDGGEEFSAEIEAALEKSEVVVVAWSALSVKSRWVRDEAAVGGDTGRLVPVTIDGSPPPMGFRQYHTLDLAGWKGSNSDERTAELLRSVERRITATAPQPRSSQPMKQSVLPKGKWPKVAAAVLALLLAGIGAVFFLSRTGNKPAAPLSVTVLPFASDSSDPDASKLAVAARDSIADKLSHGAFALREENLAPKGDTPASDFLISGELASSAKGFVATVRMVETANHVVVFSHQFTADRDKVDNFADLIGAQVASQLSWTAPLLAIERRTPSDPAITTELLQGDSVGFLNSSSPLNAFETSRRLAARAPNSPLAQALFAFNTAFALDQIPREERSDAVAEARRAAERTVKIAPDYGSGYALWCLLHSEQRKVECEDRLRKGMQTDPDDPFANWFLSKLLNNVGRNREALDLANLSLAHDQFMPLKIAQSLRMLEVSDRTDEAEDLYRRSIRWWPVDQSIVSYRRSGILERGDFGAIQRFDDQVDPHGKPDPVIVAINHGSPSDVRRACSTSDPDLLTCMLALARQGDMDAAFALAEKIYPQRRGRTPSDEEQIWLDNPDLVILGLITAPAAASLRRDPRYLGLAERVGLLEYWRNGRPPDFCRPPHPEAICTQLLKHG